MRATKKTDVVAKEQWPLLEVPGLAADLASRIRYFGEDDSKFRFTQSGGQEARFDHDDGRTIFLKRADERLVLEAKDRTKYEKKLQGKLRRSFVLPHPDLCAKEIDRQIKLLLAAYTPVYKERDDQKQKANEAKAQRHRRAEELLAAMADQFVAAHRIQHANTHGVPDPHLVPPDVEEEDNEDTYYGGDHAKVVFLLPPTAPDEEPLEGYVQVQRRGIFIEFEHGRGLSGAVALDVVQALAKHVLPRIPCKKKNCERAFLKENRNRELRLCDEHAPPEDD